MLAQTQAQTMQAPMRAKMLAKPTPVMMPVAMMPVAMMQAAMMRATTTPEVQPTLGPQQTQVRKARAADAARYLAVETVPVRSSRWGSYSL